MTAEQKQWWNELQTVTPMEAIDRLSTVMKQDILTDYLNASPMTRDSMLETMVKAIFR